MELKINCKSTAKRRNTVQGISCHYEKPVGTVRELLSETVRIQVAEYQKRRESAELLKILSGEEIEEKKAAGKIGFGCIYGNRPPKPEAAVQTVLDAFTDGLICVFVDGEQKEHLEDTLALKEGSEITFVRLVMLAGRMW